MNFASPFSISIFVITALALLGLPIGHSMIAGSVLYLLLAGQDMGTVAEQFLNGMYSNYVILSVPLFILAAELMNVGSMTDRLLRFCDAMVGRFRGGLAHVNIVQSIIFAGMSGSAIADAAGTGKMMQAMMTKDGKYPASFAAALTAVTAVIGPIIPPSIPMILYALVSDTSIGYLFLGGVIPGLLMALAQMALVAGTAKRRNFPVEPPTPLREIPMITLRAFPALMMPVVLLGGIYGGVMTPTEAAAVAAGYALLISVVIYRSVTWRNLYASLLSSARTSASIGMLIGGALVFNYVVTVENIPETVRGLLTTFDMGPIGFLLLVNAILLVLGCVLEGTAILLIVVPVFIPAAQHLGIDLVHFGVMVVVNIMLGLVTPPYGLLLFVMNSITGVPLRDIVRDVMPFLAAMIVALAVITFVPETVLWLPRLFGYEGLAMKPLYILNGPNLNRLGKREPEIYGTTTLAEIETLCRQAAGRHPIRFLQTNAEAEMIGWIHEAIDAGAGIVINAAAFTFTSLAILDALKMFPGPIIELHISNIHRREPMYHNSLVSKAATAVIVGLGAPGYPMAVGALLDLLARRSRA